MNRTNPTFRSTTLSEEETDSFLDELFSELFDLEVSSDCDKVPNLSFLNE